MATKKTEEKKNETKKTSKKNDLKIELGGNADIDKIIAEGRKHSLPKMEVVFKEAKDLFILTVETQIVTAQRIDNLANIMDFSTNFWAKADPSKKVDFQNCQRLFNLSIKTYKEVLDRVKEFTLEEFSKPELKDYFEGIYPKGSEISSYKDLEDAIIKFMSVQPYAEKMIRLHSMIQDELAKRA